MKFTKHAKERLKERYSMQYIKNIFRYYPKSKVEYVKRLTCTRSVAKVTIERVDLFFVVNRKKNLVITVLFEADKYEAVKQELKEKGGSYDKGTIARRISGNEN